jgi:chromatin segregation and condensation protein Rec8/ScpA/Scc1 (kleisin family)
LSILIYGRLSRVLLEANEDDTDKEVDRNEEQLCFQLIRLKKWKSGEEQACCKQE